MIPPRRYRIKFTLATMAKVVLFFEDYKIDTAKSENTGKFSGILKNKLDNSIIISTAFAFCSRSSAIRGMNNMVNTMVKIWDGISKNFDKKDSISSLPADTDDDKSA